MHARSRLVLRRVLPVFLGAALAASCATREPARVPFAASLVAPRALLDRTRTLDLVVHDTRGGARCDAATGALVGASGAPLAEAELSRDDCPDGASFCADVDLERSADARAFAVTARGERDAILALGCATAVADAATLSVPITLVPYVPPATCGNDVVEPGEQCDPPDGASCDDACHTGELLVSVGSTQAGTTTGGPGDKTDPALLWEDGAEGRFYAFFTDRTPGALEIAVRVLDARLEPVTTPPVLASASVYLPNGSGFPPQAAPRNQSGPAAAAAGGKIFVAFEDDDSPGSNGLDVHLRSMDRALVADQALGAPVGINGEGGQGAPNRQRRAAVAAGPDGRLFVAWQDEGSTAGEGRILGRTFAPPLALGTQNEIGTGSSNSGVRLAGTSAGWVAVWQSGRDVKLRMFGSDGTPAGTERTVNERTPAEAPSVAALGDGRFAVAFGSEGDVFLQRFAANGSPVTGDQAAPLNDVVVDGTQGSPAVAALPSEGGSWAVAWLDVDTGHVRARFAGGASGYLPNPADATTSEFQVSVGDGRTRLAPTLAVGGAGPFLAFGWEDRTAPGAGIVVRRFPLPAP